MVRVKQMKPCQQTAGLKRTRLRLDTDLLTRTSWCDARTALQQIKKGKAAGNRASLWLRSKLQEPLFHLGCSVQRHAGKVIFVGLLVLSTFCVGLKSATMQTDVDKLWVEEGGRLEKELRYMKTTLGEGSGNTNQILIQTPRLQGSNLLYPEALLFHLDAVRAATQVTVDMFDVTWSLKDICYSPSSPSFDVHVIDQILENLFPCAMITPLDCFWEGSKLLGPEFPVYIPGLKMAVQWTNLNPKWMVQAMKSFGSYAASFPFSTVEDFLKRAGITSGYQERPCLNPYDEQCPDSAPNKHSKKNPDIGAELTGGCYGFATNYMHWPEDLIVGGLTKNKTGHIVKAEALQSVIQLMAQKEMYEYWQDNYKVHNMDWTIDKAKLILESWQKKFTEEVLQSVRLRNVTRRHHVHVFSTSSLGEMMKTFSDTSLGRVLVGYLLMLGYAFLALRHWVDCVQSQSGIGVAGVVLVALSVGAGLGFCAILGIPFNASTTQIVPFLALGLGVDDMFLIAYTYAASLNSNIPFEEQTGECLKRVGVSVLLTSASNMCAFFSAAIIPVPALRVFALQVAILIIFHVAVMLLLFPAVISLDLRRHRAHRVDIFCCFKGSCTDNSSRRSRRSLPKKQAVTHALPPDQSQVVTVLAPLSPANECWVDIAPSTNPTSPKEPIGQQQCCMRHCCIRSQNRLSLTNFATQYYAPFLQRTPVKVATVIFFLAVLVASICGLLRVDDGLDLTDVVPRGTNEYDFLSAQSKYFGFFNMFAVTQGNFEYPGNQKLLHEYHEAFTRIDKIIKNDNGGTPDFWLPLFRDWLLGLQSAFDRDREHGWITREHWFPNASDEGVLAYKLMVQTGRIDNPTDKSFVESGRLVDVEGLINPKAFYNYLTAWVSNDPLAYSSSLAYFRPEPRHWIHVAQDVELKIPKSQPLVYTQLPFYLNNMATTSDITRTIGEVRAICRKYEERGLPNFPTGIPFVFWEQYVHLRFYLVLALACVLSVVFLVISVVLLNPWAAIIVVVVLALMVVQLFGTMGLLGIKLSAIPAVILITSVGIGVEFTAHITVGFLTSIGSRNWRVAMTLQHMFTPVVHGAISTLLGVLMLAFSEFDFIIRYFFHVLLAFVIIGLLNGLLLLPVLLSLIGPPAEVFPHDRRDRISTPSPRPSPPPPRQRSRTPSRRMYPRVNSEISLSTITEEPPSFHSSHEIVVHPELVLETTVTNTTTNGVTSVNTSATSVSNVQNSVGQFEDGLCLVPQNGEGSSSSNETSSGGERSSSSCSSSTTSSSPSPGAVTTCTTVTATAKVKVEVHTGEHLRQGYTRSHHHHRSRRGESPTCCRSSRKS